MMVMQMVGQSLDKLLKARERFSLKTVLLILANVSKPLEYLHNKKFVHRDLKPGNMAVGLPGETSSRIYILDLGLATRYMNADDKPIAFETDLDFVGTSRYCSVAAHVGHSQYPCDDLQSLVFILVYLQRGSLPWQGKKKAEAVKLKQAFTPPPMWQALWNTSVQARQADCGRVDWQAVRQWTKDRMDEQMYSDDGLYDWQLD